MIDDEYIETDLGYYLAWAFWICLLAGLLFALISLAWEPFKAICISSLILSAGCWAILKIHTYRYKKRERGKRNEV